MTPFKRGMVLFYHTISRSSSIFHNFLRIVVSLIVISDKATGGLICLPTETPSEAEDILQKIQRPEKAL
jgi:hypothetical protein